MRAATHHSERRENRICEDCIAEGSSNQGIMKELVRGRLEETLAYMSVSSEYWSEIRTPNIIEHMNCEGQYRTRVVGTFPGDNSALMLVCAGPRHVAGAQWSSKKYMSMKH